MNTYNGQLEGKGLRIGMVASRFNHLIVEKLVEGAEDCLLRHGVAADHIDLIMVPGAFEVPLAAKKMAMSGRYEAVIGLGAVIRGATAHYELVCSEVAKGIAQVSLETELPVIFGVVTTDTIEQALERAGTKHGNKGFEAAMTAIEMANVLNLIKAIDKP